MSLRYTLYIYYTFTIVHYIFHFINTLHLFRVLFFLYLIFLSIVLKLLYLTSSSFKISPLFLTMQSNFQGSSQATINLFFEKQLFKLLFVFLYT